jgi:disulfide bond formation protein DsbB
MIRTPVLAGLSLLVAFGALGVALGSEHFGGLVPCALCLVERWPYRIAVLFAAAALLPRRGMFNPRYALWGVVLCMVCSLGAASVHVGVEQGWWPSPLPECAAPNLGGGSIAQRLARMPAHPAKPCDDPTYLVPGIPVSMAGMNGLLALVFGGFLAISLAQPPKRSIA